MESRQTSKVRRSRRSAPKSKTGCNTCKIRHVKCDETKPGCMRCAKFGVECDGYPRVIHPLSRQATRALAPLASASTQQHNFVMLPILTTTIFENQIEKNYFDVWDANAPPSAHTLFDSAVWTRLILRSCHIPSIRYGVVAVGALGMAFAQAHAERTISPTFVSQEVTNGHHKIAVKYYNKAIKQMQADTTSNNQDLRTTLMTCLLIHCFETFHGNYQVAVAQIRTGTELIYEWRKSLPEPLQTNFPSPDPTVVENELVQAFGSLAIQTFSNPDPRPLERREALKQESVDIIRRMPSTFASIREARAYLEVILKSVTVFLTATGEHVYTHRDPSSKEIPQCKYAADPNSPGKTVHREASAMQTSTQDIYLPPYSSQHRTQHSDKITLYQINEMKRGENLAKIRLWHQAFRNMPGHRERQDSVAWLLLQLHYKTSVFALSSMTLDPMVYDDYRDLMLEIINISAKVLDVFDSAGVPFFTPDIGVILPLYLTGMKCRFPDLRARIVNMLLREIRREGIWDSIFAGKIVEWVRDTEEQYIEGEGEERRIPGWARAEIVNTTFDLQKRTATVACFLKTDPHETVPTKKEAVLTW